MQRCAVVTTGALEVDHIAAVEGLQSPVTIERRCNDLAELVAVCRTGRCDAALIIGDTEKLTVSVLAELRQGGKQIVAVSNLAQERLRLERLGVRCFPDEVSASTLAQALTASAGDPGGAASSEGSSAGPIFHDSFPASSGWEAAPAETQKSRETLETPGSRTAGPALSATSAPQGITVVWGAPGSPGRSTLAVNLAAELALANASVLLIDADTVAASIVSQLGLLEETAGLARACREAEMGRLGVDVFDSVVTTVALAGSRLALLTGLPRAERWPELREGSVIAVLEQARSRYDHVIVDIAASVEHDEDLSYDTLAPQRNAAGLACLRLADRILALGASDPVSFPRFIKALESLELSVPETATAQLEVVLNKVRTEVVGRSPRDQLSQTWRRLGESREITAFLPWDARACDAALRNGQVLAEAAPDSPLRRGIGTLAGVELSPRRRGLVGRTRR